MRILLICLALLGNLSGSSQTGVRQVNACSILKKPLNADLIKHNAKAIIKGKDACVLSLIDSVSHYILKRKDFAFIECLDSLYSVSDGYVSEYFLEIGTKLFYKKFGLIIKYAYKEKYNPQGSIEKLVIESLSSELSDTDNKNIYKKKLDDFMKKEFVKNNFTLDEIKYANKLESKINSSKFD